MADEIEKPVVATESVPAGNEQITPNPEVATDVTPVVEAKPVVNEADTTLDEFDVAKGEVATPAVKPAADVKKEVVPAKTEIAPVVKADTKPVGRDYTGLPETVVPLFKRMSNEAFDSFKPVYLEKVRLEQENKALKESTSQPTKLPESYLEHPLGYALAPEYESAVTAANETKTVFDHWAQQLTAVNDGAATYKTLARDPATGAIVYGKDMPVDKQTATSLLAFFNRTQAAAAQAEGKVSEIQQSYAQKHTEQKNQLSQIEESIFTQFKDPNHPAHPKIKSTIQELPPAFRNNPLASMTAKALVTIDVLVKALNAERSGKATKQATDAKIAEVAKAVGPSATGVVTGNQGAPVVTIDDFEKVKES